MRTEESGKGPRSSVFTLLHQKKEGKGETEEFAMGGWLELGCSYVFLLLTDLYWILGFVCLFCFECYQMLYFSTTYNLVLLMHLCCTHDPEMT